jgi:hypothetical protein
LQLHSPAAHEQGPLQEPAPVEGELQANRKKIPAIFHMSADTTSRPVTMHPHVGYLRVLTRFVSPA